jgi:hypothetical protein
MWAHRIKSRAHWRCEHCGTETRLQAHHKNGHGVAWAKRTGNEPDDRLENGECLCIPCHKKADRALAIERATVEMKKVLDDGKWHLQSDVIQEVARQEGCWNAPMKDVARLLGVYWTKDPENAPISVDESYDWLEHEGWKAPRVQRGPHYWALRAPGHTPPRSRPV